MAWLAGYSYRKAITIDHTKVSADLSYFPVVVQLTNDTDIGSHALATGYDIRFTAFDGSTLLSFERASFAIATGQCNAVFWVKVTAVSASADTVIYLYYGKTGDTDGQDITGTWSESGSGNYVQVFHMQEDPTSAAPQLLNSVTNTKVGTNNNLLAADLVNGKLGKCLSFNGSTKYFSGTSPLQTHTFTISAWGSIAGGAGTARPIYEYTSSNNNRHGIGFHSTNVPRLTYPASYKTGGTTWTNGVFNHLTGTYDGTNTGVFVNGSVITLGTSSTGSESLASSFTIGKSANAQALYWNGLIDEVRVSKVVRASAWIAAEYTNQNDPAAFYNLGIEEAPQELLQKIFSSTSDIALGKAFSASNDIALKKVFSSRSDIRGGGLAGYHYVKRIVIDHTKVSGTQTNFPVLVSISNDTDIGAHALSTGYDIRFTSADGKTLLNYERQSFSITDGACTARFWVNVPSLSSVIDTGICLYYGNAGLPDGQNKTATWDSNFLAVYHLNEAPTASVGDYQDSTITNYDSTSASSQPTQGDGKFDKCAVFSGSPAKYIDFGTGSTLAITGAITITCWVKISNLAQNGSIVGRGVGLQGNSNYGYALSYLSADRGLYWDTHSATTRDSCALGTAIINNNFHHVAVSWDGTTNANGKRVVVDAGTPIYGTSIISAMGTPNYNFRVGSSGSAVRPLYGSVEEVRVSNIARSIGWITTEYNNQNSPATFCTIEAEETLTVIEKIFSGTSDIRLGKPFSANSDIALKKIFSGTSDIALKKIFSGTSDIALKKIFSGTSDIALKKIFSGTSDIRLGKPFSANSDIALNKAYSSVSNIFLGKAFSAYVDIQLAKAFSSSSSILYTNLLQKEFSSVSDIRLGKPFSANSDISLNKAYSANSTIWLSKIFSPGSDIRLLKSFSSTNDLITYLLKIFSSSSDVGFSTTFRSANDLRVTKQFASTNDLVGFISKIFEQSSDIIVSVAFLNSNNIIEIIRKVFESTSDILSSTEFHSSADIRVSKIFSSENDIIAYSEPINFDFPLIIHISQNTRTVTVSKIKRRVAVAINERTVRVDQ